MVFNVQPVTFLYVIYSWCNVHDLHWDCNLCYLTFMIGGREGSVEGDECYVKLSMSKCIYLNMSLHHKSSFVTAKVMGFLWLSHSQKRFTCNNFSILHCFSNGEIKGRWNGQLVEALQILGSFT